MIRVKSCAFMGIHAFPVDIEVDRGPGLPQLITVGLPDASVREAKERIRTAIKNSGFEIPPEKITINLAPADVQKEGAAFDLPMAFWYSTGVILLSSLTMISAVRSARERAMSRYRLMMAVTMLLGMIFILLQVLGFQQLWRNGITLQGNVSYSFMYVIVGLHGLHVIGGVIALIVMSLKAFSKSVRNYSMVPVEVMSSYWHFVDLLWLYLLVFLLLIR